MSISVSMSISHLHVLYARVCVCVMPTQQVICASCACFTFLFAQLFGIFHFRSSGGSDSHWTDIYFEVFHVPA